MNTKKHLFTYVLFFFLGCGMISCSEEEVTESNSQTPSEEEEGEEEEEEMSIAIPGTIRDMSSIDFVAEMGVGWNLGNSLDVEDADKTAWGNVLPNQEIVNKVYDMGFRTLRVPITWSYDQQSSAPYTINEDFLIQVQETVNYGISKGMHVIIDVHHDNDWIKPTNADAPIAKERLASLWTQIATHFEPYGDKLIFETLNENRLLNSPEEWTGGTEEGRSVLNEYHETSLNAIRATGGNNADRHIMISTYAASTIPAAMDGLVVPNNDNRVIISLHTYFPWEFAGEEGGTPDWGINEERVALEAEFDYIRDKWIVQEGHPVILGEWGATNRDNLSAREEYFQFYVEESTERGLLPILWDNGYTEEFGLLDRAELTWNFPTLADIIVAAQN